MVRHQQGAAFERNVLSTDDLEPIEGVREEDHPEPEEGLGQQPQGPERRACCGHSGGLEDLPGVEPESGQCSTAERPG